LRPADLLRLQVSGLGCRYFIGCEAILDRAGDFLLIAVSTFVTFCGA